VNNFCNRFRCYPVNGIYGILLFNARYNALARQKPSSLVGSGFSNSIIKS